MTVSVIDKGILNCWPWAFIKNSFKLSESIDCVRHVIPIVPLTGGVGGQVIRAGRGIADSLG